MRNGWIKLHLSTLDNEVWLRDPLAWRVFEYLLLQAYTGSPQGVVVTSRHKIAEGVLSNNNTVYKVIKRLEKYKMVTTSVTNKYTTIRICKWHDYQTDSNKLSNNKVTTKEQQSNTLIRIKNKDIISKDITADADHTLLNRKIDKRDPNVTAICKTWSDLLGPPDGSAENQRRYAKTLHKKYGDKVVSAIKIVKQIRLSDETIKPTFGNLKDVYDKWSKIEDFYNRNTKVIKKGPQF